MAELKTELHHWWPRCVSQHWAGEDGKTGWLKPDGSIIRLPPSRLGAISNGHHIKLGSGSDSSPWDESFERAFDVADNNFPRLIRWMNEIERKPMRDVPTLTRRFVPVPVEDEMLRCMTECAVSLAVRGPMNREACAYFVEQLRGRIPTAERNALIGLNMRKSQRLLADHIGAKAKFVIVYSPHKEFVFGDGFFHNVQNKRMAPISPKMMVPITPQISIVVCCPTSYMVNPRLTTLVLTDEEVDLCNDAVQVYSRNAIYFRSELPERNESFRCGQHERYASPDNPIDSLIRGIPGVPNQKSSTVWISSPSMRKLLR